MEPQTASRTAIATSLMRAVHTRSDDPVLVEDPWGDRLRLNLSGGDERPGQPDRDAALRANPGYGTVVLRARFTEDTLADAIRRGCRQYVIVGAGMDSFALRRPAFAQGVDVIEIDHPATQAYKRERLEASGVATPAHLHFVPADLGETPLETALSNSPFRRDQPAFFAWLGVTPYLTRADNFATLATIGSCAAAGSEVVFTYLEQSSMAADAAFQKTAATAAAVGEPFITGFAPAELAADLGGLGLELIEDLGPAELTERYCASRTDGLHATDPGERVLHARTNR